MVLSGIEWYPVVINGNSTCITPIQASKLLFDYKYVGTIVYGLHFSSAELNYFTQTTILVLIAANILNLDIKVDKKPVAYCRLFTD